MLETNDGETVKRCLQGEISAYEALVDKYQKPVFNAALRMVNNFEDAEDVTQTVFVKTYQKLGTYNPHYKFFSWIYKMTVNEALNLLKHKSYQNRIKSVMIPEVKTPEENFCETEVGQKIDKALADLSSDYRIVMVLRHFLDLSYSEMSYILNVPERTVKSRLFKARGLLRDRLLKGEI